MTDVDHTLYEVKKPPCHGSYPHDNFSSDEWRALLHIPAEVAAAMVELAYPGCSISNYMNKAFVVVGDSPQGYICLFLADYNWYICTLRESAWKKYCDSRAPFVQHTMQLPEELPWY